MKLSLVLILGLCGCGSHDGFVEVDHNYFTTNVLSITNESEWSRGYNSGRKAGFDAGVTVGGIVIISGAHWTNFADLIMQSRAYQSNAIVQYDRMNP